MIELSTLEAPPVVVKTGTVPLLHAVPEEQEIGKVVGC
jgi:hypothetical protein